MSTIEKALGLFAVNFRQQQRMRKNGPSVMFFHNPGNRGFCEGCQCMKPAPKNRKKHWRCTDCRKTQTKG